MKNDLAVDSDNLKALKSFGFGWLIRKDLDRKNSKPFLNHLPLSFLFIVQWNLNLRKPDLRKNLDLRKIVGKTDFLVHKLFDLRKIFKAPMFDLRKIFFQKVEKVWTF